MENLPLADFGRVLEKISSHVVRKTVTGNFESYAHCLF